jgi:hypothetical protein
LRLVARWEKDRLCPKVVVLPQLLHLAIFDYPFRAIAGFQKHGILPYNATSFKIRC